MRFLKYLPALVAGDPVRLQAGAAGGRAAAVLRVSMIPTTDPSKALRDNQPLADSFAKEAGAKIDLTIPTSYAAVVEAVASDQIDIAYLGGFTYVQASARASVVPLAPRERDQNFHTDAAERGAARPRALSDATLEAGQA